jgi:hypothetical protein
VSGLRWGAAVSTVLLVLVAACQKELPTAPSELAEGVILFEHANYLGDSAHVTRSIPDLEGFKGPCRHDQSSDGTSTTTFDWNDCVSSIRVARGWRVEVFRDDDYSGQSFSASEDIPNLQLVPGRCDHDGLNDCVTSVRLVPPR